MLDHSIRTRLTEYASAHCFRPTTQWHMRNAWHRPLDFSEDQIERAHRLRDFDDISTSNGFLLNRFLFTLHEQSQVFLPHMTINPICRKDQESYTARSSLNLGLTLRVPLEDAVFGFLEAGIATRDWTRGMFYEYLRGELNREDQAPLELAKTLRSSRNKADMVRLYLLHKAADFLTEGSAMTGSLGGSYGPLQCAIARIFADEYGNGAPERKHATLFKATMRSFGLETYPHCYLDDYLPSALMMASYFHYLCKNPASFFKYLGAMYFAEATTTAFFQKLVAVFHDVRDGSGADLRYFDEHIDVDQKHRDIVLNELIVPAIDTYGEHVIQEIYEGFEGFRRLAGFAATDLQQQMRFADRVLDSCRPEEVTTGSQVRLACANQGFFPRIAERELRIRVESGCLELGVGSGRVLVLRPAMAVKIPRGRLYRVRAAPEQDCTILHQEMK